MKDIIKTIVKNVAPDRVAKMAADMRFKNLKLDDNNFTSPEQIRTYLSPYRLISFDLFDTLVFRKISLEDIMRKTSDFANRFIIGDHGHLPADLIYHARHKHANMLKINHMSLREKYRNEVVLSEIIDTALFPYIQNSDKRASAVKAIIEYEIETEISVLYVNLEMIELVKFLKKSGKTVIITSDMYFLREELDRILESLEIRGYFDEVFVSASVGVTKNSGQIFDVIDSELKSSSWNKIHVGDNWNNDVVQPRSRGWAALHYLNVDNEKTKLSLSILSDSTAYDAKMGQKIINTFIEKGIRENDAIFAISSAFYIFSRKAAEIICTGNYDKVFFVTRDGTIFGSILEKIISSSNAVSSLSFPKMAELAFSRRMGALLNCPESTESTWEGYVTWNVRWLSGKSVTLGNIIETFALNRDETATFRGVDDQVDSWLDGERNIEIGFDTIKKNEKLKNLLNNVLQMKKQRVVGYLTQQGVLGDTGRILLIDIGYSGTILKAFSEYMYTKEKQGEAVNSTIDMAMFASNRYYEKNLKDFHPRISIIPRFIVGRKEDTHRALSANFSWLEPFSVDRTRGSLRDYQRNEDSVFYPMFSSPSIYTGPDTRGEILKMSFELSKFYRATPVSVEMIDNSLLRQFYNFFSMPRHDSVKNLAGLSHQAGLTDAKDSNLTKKISLFHLRRDLSNCILQDVWIQGSMAASRLGWLNPVINRLLAMVTR